MHNLPFIICAVGLIALFALSWAAPALARKYRGFGLTSGVNIAEGTHKNSDTRFAEEAIATKYLLVKPGSAELGVLINGAADRPCGVCTDSPANGEECDVTFFAARDETLLVVPAGNYAAGSRVFTAAGGQVQTEPAVPGTYYEVGTLKRTGVTGQPCELDPVGQPRKLVVAAAPGSVGAIAAAMNGAHVTKFLP